MGTAMNEDVRLAGELDRTDLRKCLIHGLLFDTNITNVCPLCEHDRMDRIAHST